MSSQSWRRDVWGSSWHWYYRPQSCGGVRGGGGTTAEPGWSLTDSELIAPQSLRLLRSISPLLLSLCMYITRIILCHVLFNPSSSSCLYVAAFLFSRAPAPTPSSEFAGAPAPTPFSLEPRLRLFKNPRSFPPSPHFCILPLTEY